MFELAFPPIPTLSPKVFALSGEAPIRALIRYHHERLRKSSIGYLFPADQERFAAVIERAADFIVATAAGLSRHDPSQVHIWLRAQHFPITIDESARNVWLAELLCAFDDAGFPDEARLEYWSWVEALSIFMINRRTMITQPPRYTLAEAQTALRPFMGVSRGK